MRIRDLKGQKIAVWGSGREATSFVRALSRAKVDADVVILDETQGQTAVEGISVVPFDVEKLRSADVVVRSPGISRYRNELAGLVVTTPTNLWFAESHSPVIAFTGTKGKSTTTSVVGHVLSGLGYKTVVAGNIGRSPLDYFGDPEPEWWALELSSFQTSDLDGKVDVAGLTSFSPEHLDWHRDKERYLADKLNLLERAGKRIVNTQDEGAAAVLALVEGAVGVDDTLQVPASKLVGKHNEQLVRLALSTISLAGVDLSGREAEVANALSSFEPLPHRLEPVGKIREVLYVNDSLATTTIAVIAAVEAFAGRPVTLLLGGYDRYESYDALGEFLTTVAGLTVVTLPDSGRRIASESLPASIDVRHSDGLDEAVALACDLTPRGGVVLLSPGAPSFGHFKDYAERGEAFRRLVSNLGG